MIEKNIVNILSDPDSVKVGVRLVGGNNADLEGRYSMTFIGEMAKQLTVAIESAASVSGISESNIQLAMIFAAGTFMEHTSDNVTYRRLLLLDGVSAPRDLWIKWTRLDGESAYTVADDVEEGNILFEIDEDVDHKIREKEYRYLIAAGGDKYRNAMSRKNVTDWREVLKRAVRRGELEKVEIEVELAPETIELEARLADVLGIEVTKEAEIELAPVDDEFERAMQKAREVVEGSTEDAEEYIPEAEETFEVAEESEEETVELEEEIESYEETEEEPELVEEEPELIEEEIEELEELEELEEIDEEESAGEIDEFEGLDDDDEVEIDELTSLALAALAGAKEVVEEEPETEDEPAEADVFSENIFEIAEAAEESESVEFEIPETEDEPEEEVEEELSLEESQAAEDEAVLAELLALEPDYENITDEEPEEAEEIAEEPTEEIAVDLSDVEDSIRAEIEAKIRLEYENKARLKAEEEIAALRREQEKLRHENERILMEAKQEQERLRFEYDKLREQTKRAQAVREAQDAVRKAEQEKLRAQIETQLRAEARERERLAEAARLAIEEQRRLEAENARIARQREEEARIAEENRRRAEEEAKLEALRQAEVERIRREAEEAKAAAQKAMPEMGDGKYSYTSKSVKLVFRRSVDPNITSRIHEIIKATVEYYGKDKVYMKIKASVPDSQTVCLDFTQIPIEEMPLLGNIIKILGNSGLGIAKAIIE